MKTLVTAFWIVVLFVLVTEQGKCEQVKPPTEAVTTGVVESRTGSRALVLSVTEESGQVNDMRFVLSKDIKITTDDGAAKVGDLQIGKLVTVTYSVQNVVASTNAGPGELTADIAKTNMDEWVYYWRHPKEATVIRTATSISIIFGNNTQPVDKESKQLQILAMTPRDFVGSWISIQGEKTETLQITTNHINWTRNAPPGFHEVTDSDSNKLNDKGEILFDAKVLLTKDVSANTTVALKAGSGKLYAKVGPTDVDAGDNVRLSNPGEELEFFRNRTSTPTGKKPSPGQ